MLCGHMKKPSAVSSTVELNHNTLSPVLGKRQETRLGLVDRREHRAEAAVQVDRQVDARKSTTSRIIVSLTTAFQAEPCTPDTIT